MSQIKITTKEGINYSDQERSIILDNRPHHFSVWFDDYLRLWTIGLYNEGDYLIESFEIEYHGRKGWATDEAVRLRNQLPEKVEIRVYQRNQATRPCVSGFHHELIYKTI
jgi:hypothetical protein